MRYLMRVLLATSATVACAVDPYTFLWWAHGFHGRSPDGRRVVHVQTSAFGAAFDVEKPDLARLGEIVEPATYAEAAAQPNDLIAALPSSSLRLVITVGDVRYSCEAAATNQEDEANFPVRIIESGRFLQRFDILNLHFTNQDGVLLDAEARLEVVVWPDRLNLVLEATPAQDWSNARLEMQLGSQPAQSRGFARVVRAGETIRAALVWQPDGHADQATDASQVVVTDARGENVAVPAIWDVDHSWFHIDLPERSWDVAAEPDRLDRFPVRLINGGESPQTFRLLFAMEGSFSGITGMCPMLRGGDGNPSEIPVQISKNWHRLPARRLLYEGPWFHGATMISVPQNDTWEGELAIAYARWGGVPSASHAQLCLVGWGTNQLWDQAAIGSWGESICYDPDVNLNRSMMDDIRPVMVIGMRGGQWEWTHNVGGGDFLVYFDADGKKQPLTRMKTAYLSQGPNLTYVVYAGVSADGKIEARIEVSTPRCDDVNRAYHRVRYDVLKPTPFTRLAFYQLGADRYNDHQFTTMARGNADGLVEEWPAVQGGKKYSRIGIECDGSAAWFSLHGGIRSEQWENGAWANRGLVVRAWKARLGGKDVAMPHAAVYGTENGVPSANIELSPPPGVTELLPGDFVEFAVELLVVPTAAEDYYGPNQAFRAHLAEHAGTWAIVHRLARDNELKITMKTGTLQRALPIEVAVDATQAAELKITGGAGYVPVTVTGLRDATGYSLLCDERPVDQSIHGNDFWQCRYDDASGTFSRTYNLSFDDERIQTLTFGLK